MAQNDKAIYVFANKRPINNNVSKSVSLRILYRLACARCFFLFVLTYQKN